MPKLFDAHTHIQFAAYEKDRDEVIERALKSDIWMVNVGTQKDTSKTAIELAKKYSEGIYATVGLHPTHAGKSYHDPKELGGDKGFNNNSEEFDYEYYKNLALDPKVVAIGECGLDYYRVDNDELRIKQREVFEHHIKLANEIKKPLMIHCRAAFPDLITVLKANSSKLKSKNTGIIHFFSGSKKDAEDLLGLGFSFTFGGVVTFTHDYDETIIFLPLKNILLETDAPYVAPTPYRGRRNEPSYIVETAKKIADIKNINFDEVAEATVSNTLKLLNIG